jgi:hypothetical protein
MTDPTELPEPQIIKHCDGTRCRTAFVMGTPARPGELAARPVPGGWKVGKADRRPGWRRVVMDDAAQEQRR